MARRRKTSWRVRATAGQMEAIAQRVLAEEAPLTADHTLIVGASGAWRRANGAYTVRLVYRSRDGGSTRTFTIRGVSHRTMLGAGAAE